MYRYGFLSAVVLLFCVSCSHKQKASDGAQANQLQQEAKVASSENNINKVDGKSYFCVVNKDKRLVEIDESTQRCEVHYTKEGEKSQVAWAESTPSICSEVFARIRTNIESKGFKCQAANKIKPEVKSQKSASIN